MNESAPYPEQPDEQTRWILSRRPAHAPADPRQPAAFFVENERAENGEVVSVATILLTNRECPWRCLMCDLWQHTLAETVPPGAIPAQMDYALASRAGVPPVQNDPSSSLANAAKRIPSSTGSQDRRDACPTTARHLKIYNAGSFFDPGAIPLEDYPAIAARAAVFERVIVECHPALVGERVLRFQRLLRDAVPAGRPAPQLEVAMGLETVHPEILPRLNKRMTLEQFALAADFLRQNGVALRAFILVQPPFLPEADALLWSNRSVDFAFNCGASVTCLIPTRVGNGAMEALAASGEFVPPRLATLEAALAYGIRLGPGRVFADTWDLEQFSACKACFPARAARLKEMNLGQQLLPDIHCDECATDAAPAPL